MNRKIEAVFEPVKKVGVDPLPTIGNPIRTKAKIDKQAFYRSVAIRIPGNNSLMVVHVKEY